MYFNPHSTCVKGFEYQLGPALAILLPGRDWGIPWAPEERLCALTRQPLSRFHKLTRQPNSFDPQLYFSSIWQDAYRLLNAGDANGTRAEERDACLTHLLFLAGIPACVLFTV